MSYISGMLCIDLSIVDYKPFACMGDRMLKTQSIVLTDVLTKSNIFCKLSFQQNTYYQNWLHCFVSNKFVFCFEFNKAFHSLSYLKGSGHYW